MNEKELVEQLNQLPKEIDAKNNWQSVLAGIKAEPELAELPVKAKVWKGPVSLVASLALVAIIGLNIKNQPAEPSLSLQQQKTLFSLQQANSQYYSALGDKMQDLGQPLPNKFGNTLKDLRTTQKRYMDSLLQAPSQTNIYLKLIESYKSERKLLKGLIS